jgi:hypothetical protein
MGKPTITIRSGVLGDIEYILAKCGFVIHGETLRDLYCDIKKCKSYKDEIARIRRDVDLVDLDGEV